MWLQKHISLKAKARGFHLITDEIRYHLPELSKIDVGLCHLFLQHSSASLTINENADPDVRQDLESHFNKFVPEDAAYYRHTDEGSDDMPAHIKSSTLGVSLTVPITHGQLNLGIWQGIYLCEHRNYAGPRNLIATLNGAPSEIDT